ncbi:MAG TPA: bifunctional 3,4-dihydroxy-2-butanone-4-phosphate synthase/GTP cyclohydrolase II [Chloroflexota bacterium]|jgi:3,4-dihydroxy 2-butanone 4-phosphate synthase/GTP cyclohydrolase II|nr:bifunctional 3,4-dihydroxy-2-butanone-4-phosphate synthase/GTP cyclohydrolase II [Chloroflexota bacterium]
MPLATIEAAIDDFREGRFVIIVDDEHRENEGDLVIAAEKVTPEAVNFMARYGRGLICLPLTGQRLDELRIPMMVQENTSSLGTAFTVSIEARAGITTGISAADRATTIKTALDPNARPEDLARPGHVFPLRAREGGVFMRAGQTEASVDLAKLAGLYPAAVICEIMDDDGTMARMPQLERLAAEHAIKVISVADLIAYRRRHEQIIKKIVAVPMPTEFGDFVAHAYVDTITGDEHVALVKGDPSATGEPVLVRMHSKCLTGDTFGSLRCDCGQQLHWAMARIEEAGIGVVVYLHQEGRGIGLHNKLRAYKLQDEGADTVDANLRLGFPEDRRDYGIGAQILVDLGVRKMKIMTNNPKKLIALKGFGLELVDQIPIPVRANPHNLRYLETKRDRMGHSLTMVHE